MAGGAALVGGAGRLVKRATVTLRDTPHYRRDAFVAGLSRLGYSVTCQTAAPRIVDRGDVLVTWNRSPWQETMCRQVEQAGGFVMVAENGWIGADEDGHQLYALCRSHHNGIGTWPTGDGARWASMGVELKPVRRDGDFILVLPQRSIGEPGVAMPVGWRDDVIRRLRPLTDRRIVVREHPGKMPRPPLEPALDGCWAAVTWGSGAGIHAIAAGVPVFYDLPGWIGGTAGMLLPLMEEDGFLDAWLDVHNRLAMFETLAWAQWRVREIASGEAFEWLLSLRSS